MQKPRIVILAGPNGAGKTTVSKYLLRDALEISEFVNADYIATGLSGFDPESVAFEAGRIMLKRIDALIAEHANFAFETTLASRSLLKLIREAKTLGYRVELYYLALPTAKLAEARVALRVRTGGHNIPREVIARRFYRSLNNLFNLYLPEVDEWHIFDNSRTQVPSLIASGTRKSRTIESENKWHALQALAEKAK